MPPSERSLVGLDNIKLFTLMASILGRLITTVKENFMRTNLEFSDALKGTPEARFYLCDFHVHSPASMDSLSKMDFEHVSEDKDLLIRELEQTTDPLEYEKKNKGIIPAERYYESLHDRRDDVI